MNKVLFAEGLSKIEKTFSSVNDGSKYDKPMMDAIFSAVQKWRESTWSKVVEFLIFTFKPGFGITLPVPADFRRTYGDIPLDADYVPIKNQDNGPYATAKEIEDIFRPLMKKIQGGKDFRLRSSHIDGKFACEICYRNGCESVPIDRMRNGCAGFLTKERAEEIEEMKKLEMA